MYSSPVILRDISAGVCPCLSYFGSILCNGLVKIRFLVSKFTLLDRDIYSEGFFKTPTPMAPHREPEREVRGHCAEGFVARGGGSVGTPLDGTSLPPLQLPSLAHREPPGYIQS